MSAFITRTNFIPLNNTNRLGRALCSRRPILRWSPTPVLVSLTTEEIKPADESTKFSQSRLDAPNSPPPPPTPPPTIEEKNEPSNETQSRLEAPPRSFSHQRNGQRDEIRRPNSDSNQHSSEPPFEAEPGAIYFTTCGSCSAVYELDPVNLGQGRKVSCAVCENQWFQKPDRLGKLQEGQSFKEYPLEEKDEYIKKNKARREEYRRNRGQLKSNDGTYPRRNNTDRRGGRGGPRQRQGFSIFIGNLPYAITDEELKDFVSSAAKALSIAVIREPDGKSKGYAFATVATEEEVDSAVETLDGSLFQGRNIAVKPGRRN